MDKPIMTVATKFRSDDLMGYFGNKISF